MMLIQEMLALREAVRVVRVEVVVQVAVCVVVLIQVALRVVVQVVTQHPLPLTRSTLEGNLKPSHC